MACATLKRSLDWESLNQRPTKRRRCHPFGTPSTSAGAPGAQNIKVMETLPSPFAEASAQNMPKLTPGKFLYTIISTINAFF